MALDRLLATNIYNFHYKPGMGTGDTETQYVGVMADEASWAMHYDGRVINPVNTLGYMVLGIQATNQKIDTLNLKTQTNLSTVSDLQTSIDNQLLTIGKSFSAINNSQETISNNQAAFAQQFAGQSSELADSKKITTDLQAQLDLLKTQNQTITEFIAILDPTKLIYKDSLGNLDLTEGKLTAKDIETLGLLEAKDIEVSNLLKTQNLELGEQVSGTGSIKAGETESAKILTTQINRKVKLYITPKGPTQGRMLYYDENDIEENLSFKVKIDGNAVAKDTEFNWLIIK